MNSIKSFAQSIPKQIIIGKARKKGNYYYSLCVCPLCEKEREIQTNKAGTHTRLGYTYCQGCGATYNLSGMRFHKLIAIDYDTKQKKWDCLCDCGKKTLVAPSALIRGRTKSCGCLAGGGNIEDLTGSVFGRLTVIGYNGSGFRECLCSCGNTVSVRASLLKSGQTRSCGCLKSELHQKMMNSANNPMYNGKLTNKDRIRKRLSPQYNIWRNAVMSRDGYRCDNCGIDQYLVVHHIFSYKHYPNDRYNTDNGITLCRTCHNNFHNVWMGHCTIPCTRNDYESWKNQKEYA